MSNRVLEVVNSLYKNKINNLVIPTINGNKYEKMPKEWQIEVDKLIPGNDNANKDRLTTHSLRHTHAFLVGSKWSRYITYKRAVRA